MKQEWHDLAGLLETAVKAIEAADEGNNNLATAIADSEFSEWQSDCNDIGNRIYNAKCAIGEAAKDSRKIAALMQRYPQ